MKQMSKALNQGLSKSQMHNLLSRWYHKAWDPGVPSPVRDSSSSPPAGQGHAGRRQQPARPPRPGYKAGDMRERLANLKPIKLPKKLVAENRRRRTRQKESGGGELSDLMKRCNAARLRQPLLCLVVGRWLMSPGTREDQELNKHQGCAEQGVEGVCPPLRD